MMVRFSDEFMASLGDFRDDSKPVSGSMFELPAFSALICHFENKVRSDYKTSCIYEVGRVKYGDIEYQPEPVEVMRISDGPFDLARYHVSRKDSASGLVIWTFVFGRRKDEGLGCELMPLFHMTEGEGRRVELMSIHPVYNRISKHSHAKVAKHAIEADMLITAEKFLQQI